MLLQSGLRGVIYRIWAGKRLMLRKNEACIAWIKLYYREDNPNDEFIFSKQSIAKRTLERVMRNRRAINTPYCPVEWEHQIMMGTSSLESSSLANARLCSVLVIAPEHSRNLEAVLLFSIQALCKIVKKRGLAVKLEIELRCQFYYSRQSLTGARNFQDHLSDQNQLCKKLVFIVG